MNLGDVVQVNLPRPAAQPGHEQFGRRPAIIVQSDEAIPNLSTVLVVPCTSNLSARKYAGAVSIQPTESNGLKVESIALSHQLRAIDKIRVDLPPLGRLSSAELTTVQDELRSIMGL